jgi:hypothetical protein
MMSFGGKGRQRWVTNLNSGVDLIKLFGVNLLSRFGKLDRPRAPREKIFK